MNFKLEQLNSVGFWRSLCPELTIDEQAFADRSDFGSSIPVRDDDWQTCKTTIQEDGFFAYQSWFSVDQMDRLADCFNCLNANGIHPVFAFVFDEPWELLLQLDPLFKDLIGGYLCLPAVWSWLVTAENQSAFSPHRDQVRDVLIEDDDHLDYLTIWIPLSDLDHLSSSICVLPASLDPDYEDCTPTIRVENLQDVRALQGPKGSVFCWTTQLAHWGTKQSVHAPPRMSIGFYLQRAEAYCQDGPPLDFSKPITLQQRLAMIGQQIIDYSRTANDEELEMASRLVQLARQI